MRKTAISGKHAEPIGIERVIFGKMQEVTNPVTNVTTTIGNGKELYNIKQTRGNHFLIRLRRS